MPDSLSCHIHKSGQPDEATASDPMLHQDAAHGKIHVQVRADLVQISRAGTFSLQLLSLDVVSRLFQVSYSCIAAGSRSCAPSPVLADRP